jgi:hypothetical protein
MDFGFIRDEKLPQDGFWIYKSILTWMDEGKYMWFNFQIFNFKTVPTVLLLLSNAKKSLTR